MDIVVVVTGGGGGGRRSERIQCVCESMQQENKMIRVINIFNVRDF